MVAVAAFAAAACVGEQIIPRARETALDGHLVVLPRDLAVGATVLILGFDRKSQDATTAWERAVRTQLAGTKIGFYDMPVLAEVPGFIRPVVVSAIRREVPDVLKPNFVPLTRDEQGWKRIAAFDPAQPDAAYILLVDRKGLVRWSTHEACTPRTFQTLSEAVHRMAAAR